MPPWMGLMGHQFALCAMYRRTTMQQCKDVEMQQLKPACWKEVQRDIGFAAKRKGRPTVLSILSQVPTKVQPFAKSLRPCSSSSCKFPHEQPSTGQGWGMMMSTTYSLNPAHDEAPVTSFCRAPLVCLTIPAAGSPQLDAQIWRSTHRDNNGIPNLRTE